MPNKAPPLYPNVEFPDVASPDPASATHDIDQTVDVSNGKAKVKYRPFPTRQEITDFVREATGKLSKREIARAFGITGDEERIALKNLLREMENDGAIARQRKTVSKTGALPPVFVADIISRDPDGELIAEPVAEPNAKGISARATNTRGIKRASNKVSTSQKASPPRVIVTTSHDHNGKDRASSSAKVAGIGDRVLLRLVDHDDSKYASYTAKVIKILPKAKSHTMGIYRALPDGSGRLVPIEKKGRPQELFILAQDTHDAQDGDLISVTLSPTHDHTAPHAVVRERLGNIKTERAASLIAIHAHDIPYIFPPAVLKEAQEAEPLTLAGREDWRDMLFITIDPADAKDHDDAVYAEPDTDPHNEDGHIVYVAIADVAAYVPVNSALDREALKRGNSVYFPDRVVPMLPEHISNDLCSLKPKVERPALAVRMVLDCTGRKIKHTFHRVMIKSAAKLSYEQAQAAFNGFADDDAGPLVEPVLNPLLEAYKCACIARDAREPLYLDLPERKIILNSNGEVDRVHVPERLDAHKLIEEFMIGANVAAAETLEAKNSPLLYRVHDEPSVEKMRNLGEVLASIGLKLPKAGSLQAALFNGILRAVEGNEHQAFVNEIVLRSQAQAAYSAENFGHFGLNLRRYAHFTSPIRRYADVIVHRALISALNLGNDGLKKDVTHGILKEVGEQISASERRAMAAERDTIDRLIAHHLVTHIGATFSGRIAGVTRSGLFVKLNDTGADGFIPVATLKNDYYAYDEKRHALIGSRTGETHQLGDRVEVKLIDAAPVAGALTFEMISEGKHSKITPNNAFRKKQNNFSNPEKRQGKSPGNSPENNKGKSHGKDSRKKSASNTYNERPASAPTSRSKKKRRK